MSEFFSQVRLLDGGFGTELETLGVKIEGDPLWSARALVTHPDLVKLVHREFIRSGAEIITTNSYQATLSGLQAELHQSKTDCEDLVRLSVKLAKEAVAEVHGNQLVAGSIGPYGAILHDGSEYRGGYVNQVSEATIIDYHSSQAKLLIDAGADLLAFETVPTLKEAKMICKAVETLPDLPKWISFSCHDGTTTNGNDSFAVVIKEMAYEHKIGAVGINCTPPQFITNLLRSCPSEIESKPFVVYPNKGEWSWQAGCGGNSRSLADFLPEWIQLGTKIVGGCCHVRPKDIEEMKEKLSSIPLPSITMSH